MESVHGHAYYIWCQRKSSRKKQDIKPYLQWKYNQWLRRERKAWAEKVKIPERPQNNDLDYNFKLGWDLESLMTVGRRFLNGNSTLGQPNYPDTVQIFITNLNNDEDTSFWEHKVVEESDQQFICLKNKEEFKTWFNAHIRDQKVNIRFVRSEPLKFGPKLFGAITPAPDDAPFKINPQNTWREIIQGLWETVSDSGKNIEVSVSHLVDVSGITKPTKKKNFEKTNILYLQLKKNFKQTNLVDTPYYYNLFKNNLRGTDQNELLRRTLVRSWLAYKHFTPPYLGPLVLRDEVIETAKTGHLKLENKQETVNVYQVYKKDSSWKQLGAYLQDLSSNAQQATITEAEAMQDLEALFHSIAAELWRMGEEASVLWTDCTPDTIYVKKNKDNEVKIRFMMNSNSESKEFLTHLVWDKDLPIESLIGGLNIYSWVLKFMGNSELVSNLKPKIKVHLYTLLHDLEYEHSDPCIFIGSLFCEEKYRSIYAKCKEQVYPKAEGGDGKGAFINKGFPDLVIAKAAYEYFSKNNDKWDRTGSVFLTKYKKEIKSRTKRGEKMFSERYSICQEKKKAFLRLKRHNMSMSSSCSKTPFGASLMRCLRTVGKRRSVKLMLLLCLRLWKKRRRLTWTGMKRPGSRTLSASIFSRWKSARLTSLDFPRHKSPGYPAFCKPWQIFSELLLIPTLKFSQNSYRKITKSSVQDF